MKYLGLVCAFLTACMTGCGYTFGNRVESGVRTVSVGKVDVSAIVGEPRLAQWTAAKVRNAVATDNRLTLTDAETADAELEVRVTKLRSVAAGSAKLSSDDPDQRLYTTSIWRVEITLQGRLVAKGSDAATIPVKTVTGTAEYGDLIDITVMRQDAIRQALINASRTLVRQVLYTW